jgi:hypothetical protein
MFLANNLRPKTRISAFGNAKAQKNGSFTSATQIAQVGKINGIWNFFHLSLCPLVPYRAAI